MVALVHELDGLRAGIEPMRYETIHHHIGEAVVEICDEPFKMLGYS